jgi:hypothetical protein
MKSVIIYTYYNSPSSNYNLQFFVKKELKERENIDYVIVINGFHYDPSIVFPRIPNLTIIKRENKGFDFGGHCVALQHIQDNNHIYDYYFFMNSGVFGPIIPTYVQTQVHWSNSFIQKINDVVKLVGTTIVCLPSYDAGGYGPKVEGFFFMVDIIGLNILLKEKTVFCNHATKYDAIVNGEYGLSKTILKYGYSIDCMLNRYKNIDWRDKRNYTLNNNLHPSRKNSFYGYSIQPYEVIFHKWFWHNEENVNFNIIQQYVDENS